MRVTVTIPRAESSMAPILRCEESLVTSPPGVERGGAAQLVGFPFHHFRCSSCIRGCVLTDFVYYQIRGLVDGGIVLRKKGEIVVIRDAVN
jgi:hypothetical protein